MSFLGSFVVGILGNLYSRIFRGTGFVVMVPGILFLVPVSFACRASLVRYKAKKADPYSLRSSSPVSPPLVVWR